MTKIKPYLILQSILILYSFDGVCSKVASGKEFLSLEFLVFYGLSLSILAVYAVMWQQVLNKIPLNIAYANKAVTLVWGMLWGKIFFNETISINNIIGAFIVMAGVLLTVTGGEEKNE